MLPHNQTAQSNSVYGKWKWSSSREWITSMMGSQTAFPCCLAIQRFSEEAAPNCMSCTCPGYFWATIPTFVQSVYIWKLFHFQPNFDYGTTFLGINRTKIGRLGEEEGMQDCLCGKEKARQDQWKAKNWSRLKPMKNHEKQKVNHCVEPVRFLCLSSSFHLRSYDYLFTLVCEFFKGHQRIGRKK